MKQYKTFLYMAIFFFLQIQDSTYGQGWNWNWSELTLPESGNQQLLTNSWYALRLEDEADVRFLRPSTEDNSLYMVHDADQDPAYHNWTEILLSGDGFPHSFFYALYSTKGNNIRATSVVGSETDQSVMYSYLLDPNSPGEGWIEEASLSIPFHAESNTQSEVCRKDLNQDGIEDWILLQASYEEPFLHTYLSDPSEESGWRLISHQILPTASDPAYDFYGMNLVTLNDSSFSLLLCYSVLDWSGMFPVAGPKRLLFVRGFDSEHLLSGIVALDEGYSTPFSCVDLDDDGHDEVLVKRSNVWEIYTTSNGASLQLLSTLSPPSNVVGMETDSQNENASYFDLSNIWVDCWDDGYWASTIYRWTYDPVSQGWQRHERMLNSAPCDRFRRGTAFDDGESREFLISRGMYMDGFEDYPITVLFWEPGPYTYHWVEDACYNTSQHPYFPQIEFTNLDNDETLEGIYCREGEIVEYDREANTWVERRSWNLDEENVRGWILVDLDGDQLDDFYFPESSTALLQRRNATEIGWLESRPFEELDPPTSGISPFCISDVDGNGLYDFVYSDGSILLNHTTSSVGRPETFLQPDCFTLAPAYPNPFNPTTTITLEVPNSGRLAVDVCDILGRQVAVLMDKVTTAGVKSLTFDGTGHASGAYIIRASLNGAQVRTRQVVLVK